MKETKWIGKSGGKVSDPNNWDNGLPDFRTKAIFDVSERTEITWDLNSIGIPVDILCDPEDVIIYISGDCMVGGSYFVPDAIRDQFEFFKDDSLNPDLLDMPPPGYGMFGVITVYTWDASSNGNWEVDANWSGSAGYPDSKNDKALFTSNSNYECTLTGDITVGEVELGGTYTGNLSLSGDLTIDDDANGTGKLHAYGGIFDANGQDVYVDDIVHITAALYGGEGTIYFKGDWDNSGTFTKDSSTIILNGSNAQTITSGGNAFYKLTIANDSAVDVNIDGNLNVDNTFDCSGQLCTMKLDYGMMDPNVNTAADVTLADGFSITKGTGIWTFDGDSTYTDNNDITNMAHLGTIACNGGNLTLASWIQFDTCTIYSGDTFDAGGSYRLYCYGNWTNNGTFTKSTSDFMVEGTLADQIIKSGGSAFHNLQIVNDTAVDVNIDGDLDVDGYFLHASTLSTLRLDYGATDPNVNTASTVTISSGSLVTKGTGTWTFSGTATYTDSNGTAQNIGDIAITPPGIGSITLTLASHISFDKITIGTNGVFTVSTYNIYCTDDWANNGTFNGGTSHVHINGQSNITGMVGGSSFYDLTISSVTASMPDRVTYNNLTGCLTKNQTDTGNTNAMNDIVLSGFGAVLQVSLMSTGTPC